MATPSNLLRRAGPSSAKLSVIGASRCLLAHPTPRRQTARRESISQTFASISRDQPCSGSSQVWFTSSTPLADSPPPPSPRQQPQKPDERKLRLGQTLRILQERLPTLLQSPLPQEILSPQITLHLFPSTHPHLPTVSGRVGYSAALWTSPLAWGRVPIVGNVRLTILSERMIKRGCEDGATGDERLVVRWQTVGKTRGKGVGGFYKGISGSESRGGGHVDKITEWLGGGVGEDDTREFTGLFIFGFDDKGRIRVHTIEHVQEGGDWEKGVGARVVGLTDWLLGGMRGNNGEREGTPCPAFSAREIESLNGGRKNGV